MNKKIVTYLHSRVLFSNMNRTTMNATPWMNPKALCKIKEARNKQKKPYFHYVQLASHIKKKKKKLNIF